MLVEWFYSLFKKPHEVCRKFGHPGHLTETTGPCSRCGWQVPAGSQYF